MAAALAKTEMERLSMVTSESSTFVTFHNGGKEASFR
jgi:hypothetical protein